MASDPNVVPTHPSLVRAAVDGETAAHYHFYPDCTGKGEPEERLDVEVRVPDAGDPGAVPRLTF